MPQNRIFFRVSSVDLCLLLLFSEVSFVVEVVSFGFSVFGFSQRESLPGLIERLV